MEAAFKKTAPITGLTFAALYLLGGYTLSKGAPEFAAESNEILTYFTDQSASIAVGALLIFVAAPFWFIFVGTIYAAIKVAEGGVGRLAVTAVASAATAAAVSIVGALCASIGAIRGGDGSLDAGAAMVYFDASTALLYTGTAVSAAAFLLAVAIASIRYDVVLPKPLGYASLVLAVVFLIPPLSMWALALGVVFMGIASVKLYGDKAGDL
jgi:hypothetical protein